MPNAKSKEKQTGEKGRYIALIGLVALIFITYVIRLGDWQLVNGAEYAKKALEQDTSILKLDAARGEILDRNGEVLAGNKVSNCVKFNAATIVESKRNQTIIKVLTLLQERNEKWIDRLPIHVDSNGDYAFNEDSENEIAFLKSDKMLNLQEYATAEDCMNALISKFGAQGYSNETTRDLLSVRYSMRKLGFGLKNPYILAEDVSSETVGAINELQKDLPGVETGVTAIRYYGEDGATAPHAVGTYGALTQAQYEKEEAKDNLYDSVTNPGGYTLADKRGQTGLEAAFESSLRGVSGKESIQTDSSGNVVSSNVVEEPKAGGTVVTTIDAELQRVANAALKDNVLGNTDSNEATAAAAVVLNVKDNGVMVSASYPGFDLSKYPSDAAYSAHILADDVNKPLFDRALTGTFTPGSVFKPLVAIGALEEGDITSGTTFFCNRVFQYYDMQMTCLSAHGEQNVFQAITHSCNIFFYQTSDRLGIEPMNAYAKYFGLSEKTGVEVDETRGVMSNPEEFTARGGTWTGGNTLYAGIGQLDDAFSPIQLATYASTIANNGVRYQTHFLDKIVDYATGETIQEFQPQVVMDAKISASTMSLVQSAMRNVALEGTAASVFANYPVPIACKTGTAETGGDRASNVTFIAYAPADNPEIAVAVVMEKANKGPYAMNVAKAIFDAYFDIEPTDENADGGDGSQSTPTPKPTETPAPADGASLAPGAFFDPETDLPKASPTPKPEGAQEESQQSGTEGDG